MTQEERIESIRLTLLEGSLNGEEMSAVLATSKSMLDEGWLYGGYSIQAKVSCGRVRKRIIDLCFLRVKPEGGAEVKKISF
jgi:hypothetical protein